MSGRKPLPERVRERAWAIHRRTCVNEHCRGPTRAQREQAAREILRPPSGLTRGQSHPGMVGWCRGISASLWDRYEATP